MGWKYIDVEVLRSIDLFKGLHDRSLQEIIVLMSIIDVKMGHHIFEEGDPSKALYLVLEGEVRISKTIPGVGEEALAFLPQGSCFGEMALIEEREVRSASAIANKDCELAMLRRQDFVNLMERDSAFAVDVLWGFVRTLSMRLRNSNDKVTFLAMSSMFE